MEANEEAIPLQSAAAFLLCLDFSRNPDLVEKIGSILQKINMSAVNTTFFGTVLAGKNLLAKLVDKDPDRFLTTATEEQLEWFYAPREKALDVDLQHLRVAVSNAQEVPPLPAGEDAQLEELQRMFDEINFTRPREPDYVDPNRIEDDGERISAVELRGAIGNLVGNIIRRKVPYAPRGDEESALFYQNLTRYLQHAIAQLRKRPPSDRSGHLIHLGCAGVHCGGRYFEVAQDLYYQVTGNQYAIDGESLQGGLLKMLAARRSAILKDQIRILCGRDPGVHSFALAMKTVGKRFNVPEAAAYQYEDPCVDGNNMHFRTVEEQDLLYAKCVKIYTPTLIVTELYKHIEGIAGHPRTIKRDFRELIDGWFQEKAATEKKKYAQDPSLILAEETYHPDSYRIRRGRLISLAQHLGILVKPNWRNFWGHFSKSKK